jgi:hypothetical protein
MKLLPPIIIDNREQSPLEFRSEPGILTQRAHLRTGDYSLSGFTDAVAVERKSHQDAWACAGSSRKRFEKCVERLSRLNAALIVIEPDLSSFCDTPTDSYGKPLHTRLKPASAVGAYFHWMAVWGVPTVWAGNRLLAERAVLTFLRSWWRHRGSVWIREAMTTACVNAAMLPGSRLSAPASCPPLPSGYSPVNAPDNLSVIDAVHASSIASVTASNSRGE